MVNLSTVTQELLETIRQKNNLKKSGLYSFVAEKTGAKERQVFRWYKGKSAPQQRHLSIIEGLAAGRMQVGETPVSYESAGMAGRLDQLTRQIADLQETCGVIKERLNRIEQVNVKKKSTDGHRHPTTRS